MPEGVVDGDEEPRVAPLLHNGVDERLALAVGVVHPVHAVRRAGLARQLRGGGGRRHHQPVRLLGELDHPEGDGGVRDADDQVDLVLLVPAPRDAHPDIHLVLHVGGDHLDGLAEPAAPEIRHGHPHREQVAGSRVVRIGTGHVVEHADLHHPVLGGGGRGQSHHGAERHHRRLEPAHRVSSSVLREQGQRSPFSESRPRRARLAMRAPVPNDHGSA